MSDSMDDFMDDIPATRGGLAAPLLENPDPVASRMNKRVHASHTAGVEKAVDEQELVHAEFTPAEMAHGELAFAEERSQLVEGQDGTAAETSATTNSGTTSNKKTSNGHMSYKTVQQVRRFLQTYDIVVAPAFDLRAYLNCALQHNTLKYKAAAPAVAAGDHQQAGGGLKETYFN